MDIIDSISRVGFPIVVALFVLFKLNGSIREGKNEQAKTNIILVQLNATMSKLSDRIDALKYAMDCNRPRDFDER